MTGLQGDDPEIFEDDGHAQALRRAQRAGPSMRHGFNVNLSPHDLEDTYLAAFRATVVEGARGLRDVRL